MLRLIAGVVLYWLVFTYAAGVDTDGLVHVRALQAEMLSLRSKRVQEALEKGQSALALLEHAPDERMKLSLLADVALVHFQLGNKTIALKTAEQGLTLATA
jgi:histidinol phosphatase-like PHP family hydrolase